MVTKLYLIRHGETEGAETKRYKGHLDVPLSENGIDQIRRVAKYIVQDSDVGAGLKPAPTQGMEKLTAVYSSDLSRALNSAEIIAQPFGLKPVILPELRERNFGIWEGMSFDEIKEQYPDAFNAWASNPLQHSPIGGESTLEVRDRAVAVLEKILNQNTALPLLDKGGQGGGIAERSKAIAIVAHGGIIRVMICHMLGIPLENIFRIEQNFAALNIIEFYDSYPVVRLLNFRVQNTEHRIQTDANHDA